MSKGFNFLWIDDERARETSAKILEKNTGEKVNFYDLSGKDLAKEIERLMQIHDPDLVIVDHRLHNTIGALRDKLKASGATAAELIKDSYPHMPVVCITKVDPNKEITFAQRAAYDAILNAAHLTQENQILVVLAKGFRQIKEGPPKSEGEILQYLGCPYDDFIRLKQVLPHDVKTGFEQKGYASVLWRWVSDILLERPGFLYDSLWTATLVGAKESSFLKVQEKLESAQYSGIFANDVYPRWWASKVLEVLYKSGHAEEQDDPRLIGRAYLNIPPQGYSRCAVSHSDLPDTVAFADTTNQKRRQVCLEYTEEHPDFQKLLFFEEIRIIKEEE
jgi:DNA-binding NarL/FixJ family response regulator